MLYLYSKQPTQRQLVVAEAIRASVSKIFLDNPFHNSELDKAILTFPMAKISADLKIAKVFVSTLDKEKIGKILPIIRELTPDIRKLVAKSVKLKYTPEIRFVEDNITEKKMRIEKILADKGVDK